MDQTRGDRRARKLFEEGRSEFMASRYFEAHDIWEDLWQSLRGPDRRYLQGLIHLAVGAYHWENKNEVGARSQWQKAAQKLAPYPSGHWGIDVSFWMVWVKAWLRGGTDDPHPVDLPYEPGLFPRQMTMAE